MDPKPWRSRTSFQQSWYSIAHKSKCVVAPLIAAVSYKLGKAYDKAEKAYVRSAEAYVDANSYPLYTNIS